jgi:hypothetical protein
LSSVHAEISHPPRKHTSNEKAADDHDEEIILTTIAGADPVMVAKSRFGANLRF